MLAHRYQIFKKAWGNDFDESSDKEKRWVGIAALAKRDRGCKFEVFNELVAMRIGQLLGLPIPAGMVLEKDGCLYFASCHILAAGGQLPEADLERFCEKKPREACGAVVFDAWIANEDRHDENLWFNYYDDQFFLIDHGNSLLCSLGEQNLVSNAKRLGIKVSPPSLSQFIVTLSDFAHWYEIIKAIPDDTIRQILKDAASVGVDTALADATADWLISRRQLLPELFRQSVDAFPQLEATLFDPFGDYNDTFPDFCI